MEITGKTRIVGVIGWPVKHSLSPVFQNAAFRAAGLDFVYVPLGVRPEHLRGTIEVLRSADFAGVNVTVPHKEAVVALMDRLDPEARLLNVVNTVVNRDGRLTGYTTDGEGFLRSLRGAGRFRVPGKTVFLFGAGGSARALCGVLCREDIAGMYICNRTMERAVALKEHLRRVLSFSNCEVIPFEERNRTDVWRRVDLLVNSTSVGMRRGDPCLVEARHLHPGLFVYDIVYNRRSELLRAARRRKLRHLDGLSMLVSQGAISFELWTGRPAPVTAMEDAVRRYLSAAGRGARA